MPTIRINTTNVLPATNITSVLCSVKEMAEKKATRWPIVYQFSQIIKYILSNYTTTTITKTYMLTWLPEGNLQRIRTIRINHNATVASQKIAIILLHPEGRSHPIGYVRLTHRVRQINGKINLFVVVRPRYMVGLGHRMRSAFDVKRITLLVDSRGRSSELFVCG